MIIKIILILNDLNLGLVYRNLIKVIMFIILVSTFFTTNSSLSMTYATFSKPVTSSSPDQSLLSITTDSSTTSMVINHSMGETVIKGTPSNIIALDRTAYSILDSLGIKPIAVTDLETMINYVDPSINTTDLVDLGQMQEPNFEVILGLEPDLIIAEERLQSHLYDKLNSIAPTVMYDNSVPPESDNLTHLQTIENNILLVADAVNKQADGQKIVDRLHQKYDEGRNALQNINMNGTKFIHGTIDPSSGNSPSSVIRIYDKTYFSSQIMSELGLENVITEKYESTGVRFGGERLVGIEGFASLDSPDVHFFYKHGENEDPLKGGWKDNIILSNLDIIENNHTHPLGPMYIVGGPEQMGELIDKVVDALSVK
jgi:ferric hydroxamate transport system substrate-binding protein